MGWERGREWDGKGAGNRMRKAQGMGWKRKGMGWERRREWDGNYKAVPERDTDDKIFANYFIT